MTAASPSSLPPLSAAAEELLAELQRSAESESEAPGDPAHWLSSLLSDHPEAVQDIALSSQYEALQAAVADWDGDVGQLDPLQPSQIAAYAGGLALNEGRPIVSSQDVVLAVVAMVAKRMSAHRPTEVRKPPPPPESETEPRSKGYAASTEADALPVTIASEEMLGSLTARLGIGRDGETGVFRWMEDLLGNHDVAVDGEGGDGKLEQLLEWGKAQEAAGRTTPVLTKAMVRDGAIRYAQEVGQPVVTPQEVAIAIVKFAVEAYSSMKDHPVTAAETTEAASVEPASAPEPERKSEPQHELDSEPDPEPEPEPELEPEPEPEPDSEPESETQHQPEPDTLDTGPDLGRPRTFRLFVSSTFQDLQGERNVLQQTTFPRLRDFCTERGARFQAIDLRWGVSEEAGLDQQTMNICLGEIQRCHQVTPRPNFLILLGDRYGWLPPPPQIPADEFEEILEAVESPEERDRLVTWYRKDLNADPPEYRLRPREGDMEAFRDWAAWTPVEEGLQKSLEKATGMDGIGLPPLRRKIYRASATEQEVLAGALEVADTEEAIFCYFRRIRDYPSDESGNPPPGPDAFISADPEHRDKLQSLKLRLIDHLPDSSVFSRTVGWEDDGPDLSDAHLTELADWVEGSLKEAIVREMARPAVVHGPELEVPASLDTDPELAGEVREHRAFAVERRRFFVGREDVLGAISEYVRSESDGPLAIVGEGGTGKSALMAEATRRIGDGGPGGTTVVRFVGATPRSTEGRFLLEGLCREIALRYDRDPGEMPTDYQELVPKFAEILDSADPKRPLVLIVDSLDQLADPALSLSWIPSPLPPHVHMVVSTRPDEVRDRLEHRGTTFVDLGPMSRGDGAELLEAWLSSGSPPRRLQAEQAGAVLDAFAEAGGNPLYLKLAAEEARRWPAWAPVGEVVSESSPTEPLTTGVRGIIRDNLLDRLANEDNHGEVLVSRAIGYLAASRYGLAEDELIALLSRDPEVYAWFLKETMHLPPDLIERAAVFWSSDTGDENREVSTTGEQRIAAVGRLQELRTKPDALRAFLTEALGLEGLKLPVVFWSRLSFDLEPYLTERRGGGANLLSFYHRELGEVAADEYLTDDSREEVHGLLADYFRSRADPNGDGAWDGEGIRGLSELPYHLTHAGRWDEVFETLTDFGFLEEKAARVGIVERVGSSGEKETLYTGVFQLQDDYDRALQMMPGGGDRQDDAHPLILTAVDFGEGFVIRCPWCNTAHPLDLNWLGEEISCPSSDCGGPLKINPFKVGENGPG